MINASSFKSLIAKMRALPPAAGTLRPSSYLIPFIFHSGNKIKIAIRSEFPSDEVYFFNSAKSSLCVLFEAIKNATGNSRVLIASYTCPDITSAARKAGCQVSLFDLNPSTMEPVLLTEDVCKSKAVLLSNLYGLLDPLPQDYPKGTFIIDDMCQVSLGKRESADWPLIQVFSFGRGKGMPAAGGGMLKVPRACAEHPDLPFELLNREIKTIVDELQPESIQDELFSLLRLLIQYFFEYPRLYWIPLLIPALGIGETKVKKDFSLEKAGKLSLASMYSWLKRRNSATSRNMEPAFEKIRLDIPGVIEPALKNPDKKTLTRYPVLLPDGVKELIKRDISTAQKLGISLSYPNILIQYPEFSDVFDSDANSSGAAIIAKSIVTLPLHIYVKQADILAIRKYISDKINQ